MKSSLIYFSVSALVAVSYAAPEGLKPRACSQKEGVELTFYGFPDNDPPSANIAHKCGSRGYKAGGTGTFSDPLSMATAPGEYKECEVLYLPYLKKYVRNEDDCQECIDDWRDGKKKAHIDVWTGSSTASGGRDQIKCENSLTPEGGITVVRNPPKDLEVDDVALYDKGKCRTDHVYKRDDSVC